MWPHSAHRRRWNHQPPDSMHSTQPVPLGGTSGSMNFVMYAPLLDRSTVRTSARTPVGLRTQGTGVRTVMTPIPHPRQPPLAWWAHRRSPTVKLFALERDGKVRDKDGGDVHRPDPGPVAAEADDFAIGSLERVGSARVPAFPHAYGVMPGRERRLGLSWFSTEPTVWSSTKTSNRPRLSSIPKPSSWVTLSVADTALTSLRTAER